MSHTLSLYRLQQTDTRVDRIDTRISDLQKIWHDDETLKTAILESTKADGDCHEAKRLLNHAETMVQDQNLKIEQTEASLYSGVVRNPKELQDLQNDVSSLKRYLVTLEDRLLEAMLYYEEIEKVRQDKSINLARENQRVADQNLEINQELKELDREKERLAAERQAISDSIPEELLSLYEELRKQKRGVAVASLSENSCGTCGTTLTQAVTQAVRMNMRMSFCPSCGRILYGN